MILARAAQIVAARHAPDGCSILLHLEFCAGTTCAYGSYTLSFPPPPPTCDYYYYALLYSYELASAPLDLLLVEQGEIISYTHYMHIQHDTTDESCPPISM